VTEASEGGLAYGQTHRPELSDGQPLKPDEIRDR
jgi:hypothetical protein